METLLHDLRYGMRMLVKNPGFTAVAVVALALGIGATSAIFSVVNSVLLRPMRYREPDRLVLLNHNYPKLPLKASVSAPGYSYYRDQNHVFESTAALTGWNVNLTGQDEPERLQGIVVTANFFPTLGVDPARGRNFRAEEDQPDHNRVVIISDGLWRRRFASDPNLVGRTLTLNGESYDVIGIMPPGFQFGREFNREAEIFAPIAFTPQQLTPNRWRNEFLTVVARLKPGATIQQAQAEMDTIADQVRRQYAPDEDSSSWGLTLTPFHEEVVGEIRPALLVLLAAVGFVLLIACANVANLLLARAASRHKEIAVRTALGAGRFRIIRQLLTESVLLGIVGGGLGLLLALWGVELLIALNEANIPRAHEIGVDGQVLAFTLGVSLLTGILFGLVPALQASKGDLNEALKEGGRTAAGGGQRGRVRNLLVVSEVAIALVLLIGAGLLIKSFLRLQQVNPGFQPENLLTMSLTLPGSKYREPHQVDAFFQQALERIRALPGVVSAGAASSLPMSGVNSSGSFTIEGRAVPPGQMSPHGDRWLASTTYFETMKIPLLKGRYFTDRDTGDAPPVVIVDESLARRHWPNEDPVGKRITFEGGRNGPIWREIVGVVGHVKHRGLEGESRTQYYIPHRQRPGTAMFLVVRTAAEPAGLAPAVRGAIRAVDKDQPVARVATMEQFVADSFAQRRFSMLLLVIFAVVALVLASVGIYGVMSYSVTQRTHEIGLRLALGAKPADVLRLVVGHGMLLALAGVVLGLGAAFGLTRLMESLLFGVGAKDPIVFAALAVLLAGVALVACLVPARRAMRVDPMVALRYE